MLVWYVFVVFVFIILFYGIWGYGKVWVFSLGIWYGGLGIFGDFCLWDKMGFLFECFLEVLDVWYVWNRECWVWLGWERVYCVIWWVCLIGCCRSWWEMNVFVWWYSWILYFRCEMGWCFEMDVEWYVYIYINIYVYVGGCSMV